MHLRLLINLIIYSLYAQLVQLTIPSNSNPIYVDLSKLHDTQLRKCVVHAIAQINNNQTCISLQQTVQNASLNFVQSQIDGPCGLDPVSSTIYLNSKCLSSVSDQIEDVCLQLIGHALTGKKMAYTSAIIPTINAHFNCKGYCNRICENGGILSIDDDCSCQCPYNGLFSGENCTNLVKLDEYTDQNCGQINVSIHLKRDGILKLSKPLNENTYCQFLLTSNDPWSRFEIKFIGMDMSKKYAGSIDCPDKLQVYGLQSSPFYSVKCTKEDVPEPDQSFYSASNFLLIQIEGNRFDRSLRQGPSIHYAIQALTFNNEIRPRDSTTLRGGSGYGIGEDQKGSSNSDVGLLSDGNLSLVALLVVICGVSLIILILLAIRRHSTNKVKRNAAHSPIPTSNPDT